MCLRVKIKHTFKFSIFKIMIVFNSTFLLKPYTVKKTKPSQYRAFKINVKF